LAQRCEVITKPWYIWIVSPWIICNWFVQFCSCEPRSKASCSL
jgi:hypothetical protein